MGHGHIHDHGHGHGIGHGHHHHHFDLDSLMDGDGRGESKLVRAIAANFVLTLAQIIGGLVSGSLSLIADALHNFSDAASLILALVAVRIGRRPPDALRTFGYRRAETIAALINLTALVLIGIYLIGEAVRRFLDPHPIDGWIVVAVAGLGLAVDIYTAFLTYSRSKTSMNFRAAFLHNVSDALASLGVIVAGILILTLGWVWADAVMTLVIAGYVILQGVREMPKVIHLLMDGTPTGLDVEEVKSAMADIPGVADVHHVHIRSIDETRHALEAHVVPQDPAQATQIKESLKTLLADRFDITHSTLEFEESRDDCGDAMTGNGVVEETDSAKETGPSR